MSSTRKAPAADMQPIEEPAVSWARDREAELGQWMSLMGGSRHFDDERALLSALRWGLSMYDHNTALSRKAALSLLTAMHKSAGGKQ